MKPWPPEKLIKQARKCGLTPDLIDRIASQLKANAAAKQAEAVSAGRKAEREGHAVIYIHGRPYADPADTENPKEF